MMLMMKGEDQSCPLASCRNGGGGEGHGCIWSELGARTLDVAASGPKYSLT